MFFVHYEKDGQAMVPFLCRTLCIWATWVQATAALPQGATEGNVSPGSSPTALALIPSAPQRYTALIPSSPPRTEPVPSAAIPSQPHPPGLIPSQPPASGLVPSQPPPVIIPSAAPPSPIPSGPLPPGLIPSGPMPSGPEVIPSATESALPSVIQTANPTVSASNVQGSPMPSILSTEEGLRPIPAPSTAPTGNPDGHHEIPEPNFSVTKPCRGCSPVIEISATGFDEWPTSPIADHAGITTEQTPPKATITAGPSQVVISQEPNGGNFVIGGSTTVAPGQTVVVDNTPIVVQTSAGRTEVVVAGPHGTSTVPFVPSSPENAGSQITEGPILSPVTIGGQIITANAASQYVISGQTLQPGGPAITVDGTTVSLLPSATAIVINGVTSTLAQAYGAIYTSTSSPLLTINNKVYTANRAGYYILGPGTTLIPGGPPVTISGTVISLEPRGTAAIIQGSTSMMTPVATIVTLTKGAGGVGGGNGNSGGTGAGGSLLPLPQSTSKHNAAGVVRFGATFGNDDWLGGIWALAVIGLGWLTLWL